MRNCRRMRRIRRLDWLLTNKYDYHPMLDDINFNDYEKKERRIAKLCESKRDNH